MKTSIQKWGNSLAIRIPRAFAEEIRLNNGAEVELRLKSGRLEVSRIIPKRYNLKSLLAQVNRSNQHRETDWGAAEGKEIW
jgi:antitoxin MazE